MRGGLRDEERARLRVVLVGSRNPLNIGAAARAMANFGFGRLRVVSPYEVAFREARSAVDAEAVVRSAEEFGTVAEAVADCGLVVGTTGGAGRQRRDPLVRLERGAEAIREQLRAGAETGAGVAVVFGSEKVGLRNEDLGHCGMLMRIPTGEEQPSMNLGQAVAVVLYELIRDETVGAGAAEGGETAAAEALATAEERERLVRVLAEGLRESGYRQRDEAGTEEKVRRLVGRMGGTAEDLREWLGVWRRLGR